MSEHTIEVRIDGTRRVATVEARTLLVQALRELGLTSAHVGCETGRCGACTVRLDGRAVKSCMLLAAQADGGAITTAAGLAEGRQLHTLQQAFHEHHALQCGFCTPGMLSAALELLQHNPQPTEAEIRQGLRGNLCRCTGYQHIVDAVSAAAAAAGA